MSAQFNAVVLQEENRLDRADARIGIDNHLKMADPKILAGTLKGSSRPYLGHRLLGLIEN